MSPIADFFSRVDFYNVFNILVDGGWYHYLFPFLLIYAIVFTILNRVEIFKKYKPTKIVIAVVFGLFAVAFPITDGSCAATGYSTVTPGCTIGDYMIVLFPGVTAFTIAILALYIIAAMLGVDLMRLFTDKDGNPSPVAKYVLAGVGAIVVIFYTVKAFGGTQGYGGFWLWDLLADPFLYMILIFAGLFFWINGGDKEDNELIREKEKMKLGGRENE